MDSGRAKKSTLFCREGRTGSVETKVTTDKKGVDCRNGTFRIDCGVLCHASGTIRVAGNVGW